MDDADGAFITKKKFLQQWRDKPELIIEPYNVDTEENVIHFLARSDLLPGKISNFYCPFFISGRENSTCSESFAWRTRGTVLLLKV